MRKFLPPPYKYLNVFVSHATENKPEAEHYKSLLGEDFSVWTYEHEMLPGNRPNDLGIDAQIESAISRCDFFVLLISDFSLSPDKPYCSRELGLALKLQKERQAKGGMSEYSPRPIIVPIFCSEMAWRISNINRPNKFPVRDFYTGENLGDYDVIGHDPHVANPARTDHDILEYMRPRLHVLRQDVLTDREFLESGVFGLYEALFPENERDDPDDIAHWCLRLEDGLPKKINLEQPSLFPLLFREKKMTFCMDALFYYVSLYGTPVSFSYLNYSPQKDMLAGHYIAAGTGWRGGGLVERFRHAMEEDVSERFPNAKGILFLVEPVDIKLLQNAMSNTDEVIRLSKDDVLYDEIRRLKRLVFYQRVVHAMTYLRRKNSEPLIYTDPCLDIESSIHSWHTQEEDYWVMWYSPSNNKPPKWHEAVEFLCLEVQAKSVVLMHQDDRGAKYWQYAKSISQSSTRRHATSRYVGGIKIKKILKSVRKKISNYDEISI